MVKDNNKKYHNDDKDDDDIPARYCIMPVGEIMPAVQVDNIMLTLPKVQCEGFWWIYWEEWNIMYKSTFSFVFNHLNIRVPLFLLA